MGHETMSLTAFTATENNAPKHWDFERSADKARDAANNKRNQRCA